MGTSDSSDGSGLKWGNGSDLPAATVLGYVADLSTSPGGASVQLFVRGVPEAPVVIDDLLRIDNANRIPAFAVQVNQGLADERVRTAALRLWTGSVSPRTDQDAVAVLDLMAGGENRVLIVETFDTLKVQLVLELASGAPAFRSEVSFAVSHALVRQGPAAP